MSTIENLIRAAERNWLNSFGKGPTRTRWHKLPLQVGDIAPNIQLLDLSGNPVELGDYWRDGPAVLVFLRHYGCGCAAYPARTDATRATDGYSRD